MNTKEKAKELVERFQNSIIGYNVEFEETAKQCALICVEEIMHAIERFDIPVISYDRKVKYYQQVKEEIGKLP